IADWSGRGGFISEHRATVLADKSSRDIEIALLVERNALRDLAARAVEFDLGAFLRYFHDDMLSAPHAWRYCVCSRFLAAGVRHEVMGGAPESREQQKRGR